VKCPKCDYLGFETGDTCKNCGYDFSLLAEIEPDRVDVEPIEIDFDLDLRAADLDLAATVEWPETADNAGTAAMGEPDLLPRFDESVSEPRIEEAPQPEIPRFESPRVVTAAAPALPLFTRSFSDDDDEPLIKLPAAPRPPLAVRRTPDTPRLRVVPKPMRSAEPAPVLAFEEPEIESESEPGAEPEIDISPSAEPSRPVSQFWAEPVKDGVPLGAPGLRLGAAAIDHLLLAGVDAVVIYFTTRIAGLAMGDWAALPPAPMVAFLLMLKLSYFAAFTAVGGQTIGKMALGLRVVGADRLPVDGALAVKRTLAGAVSGLLLGLGFVPAFFDSERRTLHDRVARTRVVSSPSA
jgi:uncharacterized RDD family membrane protein YckC